MHPFPLSQARNMQAASQPGVKDELNLARDMIQALGLAAAAGIGAALASGLVVVLIALAA